MDRADNTKACQETVDHAATWVRCNVGGRIVGKPENGARSALLDNHIAQSDEGSQCDFNLHSVCPYPYNSPTLSLPSSSPNKPAAQLPGSRHSPPLLSGRSASPSALARAEARSLAGSRLSPSEA